MIDASVQCVEPLGVRHAPLLCIKLQQTVRRRIDHQRLAVDAYIPIYGISLFREIVIFVVALGRVVAELRPFTRGVLDGEVQGREGRTPFAGWVARYGLWPLAVLALAAIVSVCLLPRKLPGLH